MVGFTGSIPTTRVLLYVGKPGKSCQNLRPGMFLEVLRSVGKRKRWRDRFNLALANQQSLFYLASYFASVLNPKYVGQSYRIHHAAPIMPHFWAHFCFLSRVMPHRIIFLQRTWLAMGREKEGNKIWLLH